MRLMYVGAALSLVSLAIALTNTSAFKTAVRKAQPSFTQSQVNSTADAAIAIAIIFGLLGVGLWVWMAWANGGGRNWARILSTVFFGIDTLGLLGNLARATPVLSMVFAVLIWLVGLATVILLWRGESATFFKSR
jgi:hypothetical protein